MEVNIKTLLQQGGSESVKIKVFSAKFLSLERIALSNVLYIKIQVNLLAFRLNKPFSKILLHSVTPPLLTQLRHAQKVEKTVDLNSLN